MMAGDAFRQVREAITLSSYVESTFGSTLRDRGQGKFSTACPVHGGDNPTAFQIDDNQGLWRCFSQCGTGGDVITLWLATNKETNSKREALVALAQYAGVSLPERDVRIKASRLYAVMERAAEVFEDALMNEKNPIIGETDGADEAFRWATEERGMDDDTLALAQLGFVPDTRGLRSALEESIGSKAELMATGLLAASAAGNIYCPFAGRLVFPIRDLEGRVTGFGARVVPNVTHLREDTKFVNTKETEIYDKSNVLYGADLIDGKTTRVFVCEGYLDAIAVNALQKPGVVGVAACGTSVTGAHVELLLNVLSEDATVTFVMDGDDAGLKAMARLSSFSAILGERGFGILLEEGEGKDPWEMYRSGTLLSVLSGGNHMSLSQACVSASFAASESDGDFDKAVSEMVLGANSHEVADVILKSASKLRGERLGDYVESIRRLETPKRSRATGPTSVLLSPPVRHLVARMMQLSPVELESFSRTLRGWDDDTEALISNWLPVATSHDVEALRYVFFPYGHDHDQTVIQSVASCIASSEDEGDEGTESILPVVHSLARLVISAGAKDGQDVPRTVLARTRAVRSVPSADISPADEVDIFLSLLDIAMEYDAAVRA